MIHLIIHNIIISIKIYSRDYQFTSLVRIDYICQPIYNVIKR